MNILHFLLLLTIGLLASCTTGQEKKVLRNLNSVEPKNSKLSPKKLSSKQLLDAKKHAKDLCNMLSESGDNSVAPLQAMTNEAEPGQGDEEKIVLYESIRIAIKKGCLR